MASKILFIYEGENAEPQISKSMQQHIFVNRIDVVVEAIFKGEIYQLYDKLDKDHDLDIFSLLKERNNSTLKGYSKDDFSEIYLFFDYDGHASTASNDKLGDLLNLFDNETLNGLLYISYPMVEAIKDINELAPESFGSSSICCNQNISYKNLVANRCDNKLKQYSHYNIDTWRFLIDIHLRKANLITAGIFSLPTKLITQSELFNSQLKRFIVPKSEVGVVSAFPMFIHDYYGNEYILKLLLNYGG